MDETKTRPATRSTTVTLGGKEFTVYAANMRHSRQWRQQFQEPVSAIMGILQNAHNINLESVADIAGLLNQAGTLLVGSVDFLIDAMFAYSPELQAHYDWILDHADDEEAIAALWEVLKLAYPFGNLVSLLDGQASSGTSSSSPALNGASRGRKK
jgi:hypothetical protein